MKSDNWVFAIPICLLVACMIGGGAAMVADAKRYKAEAKAYRRVDGISNILFYRHASGTHCVDYTYIGKDGINTQESVYADFGQLISVVDDVALGGRNWIETAGISHYIGACGTRWAAVTIHIGEGGDE